MDQEELRRNRLNRLIMQYNEKATWNVPEHANGEITEMFEVDRIEGDLVVLRYFFEERKLGPVSVPPSIRLLLRPDDLFLLTLHRSRDRWYVGFMSTLYETWDTDEVSMAEWH